MILVIWVGTRQPQGSVKMEEGGSRGSESDALWGFHDHCYVWGWGKGHSWGVAAASMLEKSRKRDSLLEPLERKVALLTPVSPAAPMSDCQNAVWGNKQIEMKSLNVRSFVSVSRKLILSLTHPFIPFSFWHKERLISFADSHSHRFLSAQCSLPCSVLEQDGQHELGFLCLQITES